MRSFLFLLPFLGISVFSAGQHNLSDSRKTSPFTYIYSISEKETEYLYKSNMKKAGEKYLHSLVDSFQTGRSMPAGLKTGNYLLVYAKENELNYELKTVGDVQYKLVSNNRDLAIVLHAGNGSLINDAAVFLNKKRIPFDKATQTYWLAKRKRAGLIEVKYKETVFFFPIEKRRKGYYYRNSSLWYKIAYSFPLKYISNSIKNKASKRNRYPNYFNSQTDYEKKFTGFIVFDKPKYKPGDTVKFKAYIINRKGSPVHETLLLRLTDKNFDIDTILATIKPYRSGGYTYEFVITDSLDLTLDEEQMITLETSKSRRYDIDDYDGDLEEDEYAMKRQVLMRGKFYYEDYELGGIQFSARSDKQEHQRGNPVSIYLKARDENNLAVLDGRVQVIITPDRNGAQTFYGTNVFLPDTIWNHSEPIETIGETKITIPDSIFPSASFSYNIECIFLNSNNEYKSVSLNQSFQNNPHKIYFTLKENSLKIEQFNGFLSEQAKGMIYAFNEKEDTILSSALQLPATIAVNPFVKHYEVETDSADEEFELRRPGTPVSCIAFRNKDSINLRVNNPGHLNFWYSIFAGNKIISRGYTDSLFYVAKTKTPKNYFVSLQYIYGGLPYTDNYTVPYQDRLLTIHVDQPDFIYPGQATPVNITVTDVKGKPVNNADITAYGFTSKFENQRAPYIPYLGKIYKGRKGYAGFNAKESLDIRGSNKLNWERWSKEMRLDSIEYFKFLHPQPIYINTESVKDSITQLAPFLVLKGDIQPIQQIYIDETPFYFSQAQQLQRYSFNVTVGKHSLRLRTRNSLIKIDSVWAFKGMKTFISIDADTIINKLIKAERMPDTLMNYEKKLWSRYMILIENNFGENFAAISQPDHLYLLNPSEQQKYNQQFILTGPFSNTDAVLSVKNKFQQSFEPEGNSLFHIEKGLIKQRQIPYGSYPFRASLSSGKPLYDFHDRVLTEKEIDSLWQDYLDHRSANEDLFKNAELNKTGNGELRLAIKNDYQVNSVFLKNILLFRYDDPDFARVYKGSSRNMGYIQPGKYRLFLLLKDNEYYIKDSLEIIPDGINYYKLDIIIPNKPDSISKGISAVLESREKKWISSYQENDLNSIKEKFNERYLDASIFSNTISGTVTDKSGAPVVGASILVKSTRIGTSTNSSGNFTLKSPSKGTIVIAAVGYQSVEKRISESAVYQIQLSQSISALSEVVVIGYGVSRKRDLTASFGVTDNNMLAGKVAGIIVRGISSFADSAPLIIVDGLPYSGTLESLDSSTIGSVNVLKGREAEGLYGEKGSNGVIIITTKRDNLVNSNYGSGETQVPGNSLRHNFRDAAYWQPQLRTDANGKVSFNVQYPDDITSWRTFVIAIGDKKQTGFIEKNVKSFKSLSASLSFPQFAIEGDSINVIGKVLNYSLDTINIRRKFSLDDSLLTEKNLQVKNSLIDTFLVLAGNSDSLKLKYTVQKNDGYFDGEEKSIPVFRQGVLETKGFFAAMDKDTSFSIEMNAERGKIKLYAESSVLPVLLDEIENIHRYEYLCNEQLASKLKALLLKKKIYSYLKKEFTEEKNINELIFKLNQSKAQAGLWGWWNGNEPTLWISRHAIEALLMAEKADYKINLNKQALTDYLVYNFESYNVPEKISSLFLLQSLDAKVDFKKYINTIENVFPALSLNEKLQALLLKQTTGLNISIDSLFQQHSRTIFGNIYWGDENRLLFNNSVQNTLLMYRLMKSHGGYETQLRKVQNYFLEKRKDGQWANTYESSLILETILPDLMEDSTIQQSATLIINSGTPIRSFPFSAEINAGNKIMITKQGRMPVYFTAYQQHWNNKPQKVSGDFTVTSYFEQTQDNSSILKAGVPAVLKVKVEVKSDADYVMIEIPIPAGCSYKDKNQSYFNYEVHREYFKNKVSIFCKSLPKGYYSFGISLIPRYTGSYHLNPAKAEMMYFPVFFGREQEKNISIQ